MSSVLHSIVPPYLLVAVACLTPFTWLIWRVLQVNTSFPDIETKFVFIAPPAILTRLFSFEIPGLAWVNDWTWRARYEGEITNTLALIGLSTRVLGLFGGSQRDIVAVQSVYPTTNPWLLIADPVTVKVCTDAQRAEQRALKRAPRQLYRATADFPSHMPSFLSYGCSDLISLRVKALNGGVIDGLPTQALMNQIIDLSGIHQ